MSRTTKQGVRDLNPKAVNGRKFPKPNPQPKRTSEGYCTHYFVLPLQGTAWGIDEVGNAVQRVVYGSKCGWCGEEHWD